MTEPLTIMVRGACEDGSDCHYPDCGCVSAPEYMKDALAALEAAGLRIVPVEPTKAMLRAADTAAFFYPRAFASIYKAMLSAGGTDAKP